MSKQLLENKIQTGLERNVPTELSRYEKWLNQQPLSRHTKRSYAAHVKGFIKYVQEYLSSDSSDIDFSDKHTKYDYLVRQYKSFVLNSSKWRASSINKSLVAIDHFYGFIGIGVAGVEREKINNHAPRILAVEERKRLLEIVETCRSRKDKALVLLLLHTGIRLGECASLNVDDVVMVGTAGSVLVSGGREKRLRQIPLNAATRQAIHAWLVERNESFSHAVKDALFINQQGKRISTSGLDAIVRKIGARAGLVISARVLRDTCLAELAEQFSNPLIFTKVSGHTQLQSVSKYFEHAGLIK